MVQFVFSPKSLLCNSHAEEWNCSFSSQASGFIQELGTEEQKRGVLLEPSFDLFLREVLLLLLGKLADMPESLDTSKVFQLMLLLKWSLSLRKTADLPYPGAEGCGTFHMVCVSLVP